MMQKSKSREKISKEMGKMAKSQKISLLCLVSQLLTQSFFL